MTAFIMIYDFIIKMKTFWDLVYFDKISYIYNTKFVFNDQQNTNIRKEYEQQCKRIKENNRAKYLLWVFIILVYGFNLVDILIDGSDKKDLINENFEK